MMLKKILVPFDDSALSKKALELAKDITRNFNAELAILVVIPAYYPISDSVFAGVSATNYKNLSRALEVLGRILAGKVTEKCREEGVKASYKVILGDVSQAIISQAKKGRTDLTIMRSRRMTGDSSIKRHGSTARYVSEHAPCPVTIVH